MLQQLEHDCLLENRELVHAIAGMLTMVDRSFSIIAHRDAVPSEDPATVETTYKAFIAIIRELYRPSRDGELEGQLREYFGTDTNALERLRLISTFIACWRLDDKDDTLQRKDREMMRRLVGPGTGMRGGMVR